LSATIIEPSKSKKISFFDRDDLLAEKKNTLIRKKRIKLNGMNPNKGQHNLSGGGCCRSKKHK
jgi:hypothetical protein